MFEEVFRLAAALSEGNSVLVGRLRVADRDAY